jgi:two-component system chemotaxis response regulator CheY
MNMANRILIVDDAAFMRMMIRDILSKNGYEVVGEAQDGAQAVEKYKELKPDLITMDITMPEMDGISALKEIKKMDGNAKVIMCSAMGQQAMVIDAIQAGAKDFIVKPFQADRVIEAIKKTLG